MITKRLPFDFGQERILPKHEHRKESMPPCTFFVHSYIQEWHLPASFMIGSPTRAFHLCAEPQLCN